MEKFYTVKEVAEILKVKDFTIRDWITNSKLQATKVGRVYRITESQLKDFLQKQQQQ